MKSLAPLGVKVAPADTVTTGVTFVTFVPKGTDMLIFVPLIVPTTSPILNVEMSHAVLLVSAATVTVTMSHSV